MPKQESVRERASAPLVRRLNSLLWRIAALARPQQSIDTADHLPTVVYDLPRVLDNPFDISIRRAHKRQVRQCASAMCGEVAVNGSLRCHCRPCVDQAGAEYGLSPPATPENCMPPTADNAPTTARFLISQLRSRRSHHSSRETTRTLGLLGFTSERSTATSILRRAKSLLDFPALARRELRMAKSAAVPLSHPRPGVQN